MHSYIPLSELAALEHIIAAAQAAAGSFETTQFVITTSHSQISQSHGVDFKGNSKQTARAFASVQGVIRMTFTCDESMQLLLDPSDAT
jgi:hypothetical protein